MLQRRLGELHHHRPSTGSVKDGEPQRLAYDRPGGWRPSWMYTLAT
nr:hypothetical protein [Nonomuraea pusilla]